jgi:phosphoribosylanthranilate isomerase
LGFNFYPQSPRYLCPQIAKDIITKLPQSIIKIGIFIATPPSIIKKIMTEIKLDYAQVYEEIEGIDKNKLVYCLKPQHWDEVPPLNHLQQYAYVLIDTPFQDSALYGGTGLKANWKIAARLSQKVPLILAGGLTPSCVRDAILQVKPFALDVCSGVEKVPRIKCPKLLTKLMKESMYA